MGAGTYISLTSPHSWCLTRTLSYQYDRNGNRARLVHPDGQGFGTAYDGLNRPYWMVAEYVNGIASMVYTGHGAAVALNRVGASLAFDHDGVQRPVVRGFLFPQPASNVTWVHGWNPASGLASDTRHGDDYAWTGAYNAERPYATNGLNQYATTGPPNMAGSVAFTYDPNGNLASETPWGGATTSYTYDIENRLVARSGGVTLRYDPLGRLYEVAAPSATTRFLYDGDALIAEYNASGTMLRRHVHWPGADVPLTTYEGAGFTTVRQLFPDRQGSIAAIADGSGTRIAVNSYDEYGIPGAGNTGRFQYTGQIWLAELGMYHYKARLYSPTLGRFLQTDPIGYDDQFNLYAYVGNDPVNLIDPSGMCSSVADDDKQTDCLQQRENQIERASAYLSNQSIRSGSREAAYIATYNEDTGEVTERVADAAGRRSAGEVVFTNSEGDPLRARNDGRIVERGPDGGDIVTREVVLVTGHGHPKDGSGGLLNSSDWMNRSIGSNPTDRQLSNIAPAIIKTPNGAIRVYVNERRVR